MRLTALAAALVLAGGCLTVARAQDSARPTRDPVAGKRLFVAKGCAICHPVDGQGGGGGPDLAKAERSRTLYDLVARMWNHVPQMAGRISTMRLDRPYLTADELSDLMAFLGTLGAPGARGRATDEAPLAVDLASRRRGEQAVADKGCLQCHTLPGVDARGKSGGSFDRWIGHDSPWTVMATMWNHAFLMDIETRRQGRAWPRLSAAEMADLAAFLARR